MKSAEEFVRIAEQEGRAKDAIRITPETGFNFLDYLARGSGDGRPVVANVREAFEWAAEILNRSGQGADSPFFVNAMRQLLDNTLDTMLAARDEIRVDDLYGRLSARRNSSRRKRPVVSLSNHREFERDSRPWHIIQLLNECSAGSWPRASSPPGRRSCTPLVHGSVQDTHNILITQGLAPRHGFEPRSRQELGNQ
jgi:hypothetical protein